MPEKVRPPQAPSTRFVRQPDRPHFVLVAAPDDGAAPPPPPGYAAGVYTAPKRPKPRRPSKQWMAHPPTAAVPLPRSLCPCSPPNSGSLFRGHYWGIVQVNRVALAPPTHAICSAWFGPLPISRAGSIGHGRGIGRRAYRAAAVILRLRGHTVLP